MLIHNNIVPAKARLSPRRDLQYWRMRDDNTTGIINCPDMGWRKIPWSDGDWDPLEGSPRLYVYSTSTKSFKEYHRESYDQTWCKQSSVDIRETEITDYRLWRAMTAFLTIKHLSCVNLPHSFLSIRETVSEYESQELSSFCRGFFDQSPSCGHHSKSLNTLWN